MDFSAYATGDGPFYEPQPAAAPLRVALPEGWLSAASEGWTGVWPANGTRRTHGWKIHLSLRESTYDESLRRAAAVCVRHAVAFKYVPSVRGLIGRNAKNADRTASGKAMTIYPASDGQLEVLARELDGELQAHAGPYILSDVRFGRGPVYFRYGAFEPLAIERDGRRLAALPSVDGILIEDVRAPYFVRPAGSEAPPAVAVAIAEYGTPPAVNPLAAYRSLEPIQFSNAGGVYRAVNDDGGITVIKEARRHAGTDANGKHAPHRLRTEWRNLVRLGGAGVAPKALRLFEVLEHVFLEMEFIDGRTLADRTVAELPALRGAVSPSVRATYAKESEAVTQSMFDAIASAHARGVVVGDLHPGNVIVGADLHATLIDLEDDRRPSDIGAAPFNALGYRAPEGLDAAQGDWFAFTRCVASMFDPSFARELLAPDHWDRSLARIEAAGTSASLDLVAEASARAGAPNRRRAFAAQGVTASHLPADLAGELRDGLRASRRPGQQRRFPGDPRGLTGFAQVACAYGLGGIVHTQLTVGDQPDEADIDHLVGAISFGDRVGLFDGTSGLAHVLNGAGRPRSARAAFEQARALTSGTDDCSLATGMAGVALASLAFDEQFAVELAEMVARRVLGSDGSTARQLDAQPGLLGGWSGIALALALVSSRDRSDLLRDAACTALERECRLIGRSTAGTFGLREPAGDRVFPYLANGTAGLLLAMTTLRRAGLLSSGDPVWERHFEDLVQSCSGGAHVFDGLFHGAAGLLVAMNSAVDYCSLASEPVRELERRLAARSFRWNGTTQMAGDGCLRLASDLATGSAGVLLSLPSVADPLAWIPALTAPARTSSERR